MDMKESKNKQKLNAGADAVLLIDVLNDLEFPGGDKVLPWAERLVTPLRALCAKARRAGIPVIYVNDNYKIWKGERESVYAHCTRRGARGRRVSQQLKPTEDDYFILKPRHSAFFATPLLPLLEELKIKRLVLTGIATNLCVLMTAHDASMHRFPIIVLSDCCAAETDFDHNAVLTQLQEYFGVTICRSTELRFAGRSSRWRKSK